jgi:L-malate glycosyltransferase
MTTGLSAAAAVPVHGASTWPGRIVYEVLLAVHWCVVRTLRFRSRSPLSTGPRRILLTGTFFAENWALNHIKPLAASAACERVLLVTTFPLPPIDNLDAIRPPGWAIRLLGEVPARLLTFMIVAVRERPDAVGGFHILPNALLALLMARVIGCRSIYFCGGGSAELEGGGYYSGARTAALLKGPDAGLERRLLRAVKEMDLVVTMGNGARNFFIGRDVATRIEVVPGGIDFGEFAFDARQKSRDLILVGRLHPVKRIDLFLRAVKSLSARLPRISAVVLGDGELAEPLRRLSKELRVDGHVTFAGHQSDVKPWLAQSKVFVLTSESEGLSLAMMEAMLAGLPCVVADVGELGELVEHGTTGFLVEDATPDAFADRIELLLTDDGLRQRFAAAGRNAALRFTTAETTKRWDRVLGAL